MSTLQTPFAVRHKAKQDATVQGDCWRFTFLTDGLLRYEWADDGVFEDRASTFAINRDLPVPSFRISVEEPSLEIHTDRMKIVYDRKAFSPSGFSVQLKGSKLAGTGLWRYGLKSTRTDWEDNLGGTTKTLDEVDGRTQIGEGVLSRTGFAAIDDSKTTLLTEEGWYTPRAEGNRVDGYLFVYGLDFKAAMQAFYAVSGPQPLLPRWALGNWWSKYYAYEAQEYLALMDRFKEEGAPLSVAVLDMDWHRVYDVPERYGDGWTGYSWNRKLFPEPEKFLDELHKRDLKTTLNVHPADGVRAFEDAYQAMAKALKHDTTHEDAIDFDCASRDFMRAYFDVLHRGLEEQGVDFWWIDWQQGPYSRQRDVDPLWVLNHYHFLDSGRGDRRPLTFSRYSGPGSHRYPVGFSGDTCITWDSLHFQPEFTSRASNIGYGHWSHDIGGHFFGRKDDELSCRWYQLGVFSPILRLHSTLNQFNAREPWRFNSEVRPLMIASLRLRHRLMPYLYTMNVRAARDNEPLVQPMYWSHSKRAEAYGVDNQFYFGSELLVMPITSPRDEVTRLGRVKGWLPPGRWVDIFSGVAYDGNRELFVHRAIDAYPVFARAGSIMPMDAADIPANGGENPTALEIQVVVGADAAFEMHEDDGKGTTVSEAKIETTTFKWSQDKGQLSFTTPKSSPRDWSFRFIGVRGDIKLEVAGDKKVDAEVKVTPAGTIISIGQQATGTAIALTFTKPPALAPLDPRATIWPMLDAAHCEFNHKVQLWEAASSTEPLHVRASHVAALCGPSQLLVDAILELVLASPQE